jgi:DNA-binding CsgD family transcriptional regulator
MLTVRLTVAQGASVRTAGGADWIGILEAAYRPAVDRRTWLQGVVEAARPALDCGFGLHGLCFDPPTPGLPVHPRLTVGLGLPAGFEEVLAQFPERASPEVVRRIFSAPCGTFSGYTEDLGEEWVFAYLRKAGVGDTLGVLATDPSGCACMLTGVLPRATRPSRGQVALWSRIAAHIAAGHRLQQLAEARPAEEALEEAEAILDERTRVAHASGPAEARPAREALREAATRLMHARGKLRRRDAGEAVAAWRALVAGRWSLVDHFDHDSRRFLVARRNDPRAPGLAGLTLRERQAAGYACLGHSNKLIAYELGLSASTVATYLTRAAAVLGATTRAGLIERYALGAAQAPSTEGDGS